MNKIIKHLKNYWYPYLYILFFLIMSLFLIYNNIIIPYATLNAEQANESSQRILEKGKDNPSDVISTLNRHVKTSSGRGDFSAWDLTDLRNEQLQKVVDYFKNKGYLVTIDSYEDSQYKKIKLNWQYKTWEELKEAENKIENGE